MTKAAVTNMIPWLAEELRSEDIRINALAPGLIITKLGSKNLYEKGQKK